MSVQTSVRPAELRDLLSPLLTLPSPESETRMGRTVGEGLVLPDVAMILKQALPRESTRLLMEDTSEWIQQILHPKWLPDDLGNCLFAVPKALNGEDAFVGGWISKNRFFQIVITRERVHLLSRLTESSGREDDEEKARRALWMAYELLQIPENPDLSHWRVQPFGGLVLGTRVGEPFAREWYETLLFLTDGSGVKYSVMKYKGRTSPPKQEGPRPGPTPWFSR